MQKVNFSWQLIIADDFSTDGTRDILKEYQQRHPQCIKLILQEENVGPAKNWFDLISFPQSEYISYFEGDDYWTDAFKLQKQVDFLESNKEFAVCFHNAWIENLITSKKYKYHDWQYSREVTAKEIIEVGGYIYPTASIVFRNVIDIDSLASNLDCPAGDLVLALELLKKGKFYFLNEFMSVYRRHEKGVYSGIISNPQKIQKNFLGVINFLERTQSRFPMEYQQYFKGAIKSKYHSLFMRHDYSVFYIFRLRAYFSLGEILKIIIHRVSNAF